MKQAQRKDKLPLTILIPARKEEVTILNTLRNIDRYVSTPHTTIVVNDKNDSQDLTADIVSTYTPKNYTLKIYIYNSQRGESGFSGAILLGLSKILKGAVVIVMADGCDELTKIDLMYEKICQGWDVVCGSRYAKNGRKIGGTEAQEYSFIFSEQNIC